jgi:hypothetical protein
MIAAAISSGLGGTIDRDFTPVPCAVFGRPGRALDLTFGFSVFQRSFTASSVRPGKSSAICVHRFPYVSKPCWIVPSSSSENGALLMLGSK